MSSLLRLCAIFAGWLFFICNIPDARASKLPVNRGPLSEWNVVPLPLKQERKPLARSDGLGASPPWPSRFSQRVIFTG
jgi:hypothetical protein